MEEKLGSASWGQCSHIIRCKLQAAGVEERRQDDDSGKVRDVACLGIEGCLFTPLCLLLQHFRTPSVVAWPGSVGLPRISFSRDIITVQCYRMRSMQEASHAVTTFEQFQWVEYLRKPQTTQPLRQIREHRVLYYS